jgi:alkylation response protein AidB-like acyl-CoA dehydrogenase
MFLTDEQHSIKQLAREFAQKVVLPVSQKLESGDLETLKSLWQAIAEAGFPALPFPEAYGGTGADSLSYFVALEEIANVSAALATALSVHVSLVGLPILGFGTDAQKEQYLPDLVSARKIGAFALTEANAGSDAGSGLCRATLQGDHYLLNGTKLFITNALLADVFMVTARTNPDIQGSSGLTAFIVDRSLGGFDIQKGEEKMGLTGGDWGELIFQDCPVDIQKRLGAEGQGFKLFMNSLNVGRIGSASVSLGLAQACLDASLKYAKERQQFGKPIADFQAIQFKLADMATQIEAARALVYNAARLKDAGLPHAKEASMAKLYASEIANLCANQAVQIHGGYGYTKDFPVERYFRDARVMSLFEGTSEIQHVVIAKQILLTP